LEDIISPVVIITTLIITLLLENIQCVLSRLLSLVIIIVIVKLSIGLFVPKYIVIVTANLFIVISIGSRIIVLEQVVA